MLIKPLTLMAQLTDSEGISYGWQFAKMITVMLIVIALALIILKYFLPLLTRLRRHPHSSITILDHQSLDARKSVYLLQIKDKQVAVALSEHGVAKLAEWSAVALDDGPTGIASKEDT